jgi:LmbE family N-acetylglucosaminyl deacetylase
MSKRVFAIAAHPDDIEFVMSGTMMRLKSQGFQLHYMNIANGCCGSTDHDAETTAAIRREEAQRAARLLGAVFHDSIARDLEIFYDHATLTRLASVIREVQPEIILTHSPQDYMEDHMNTCRLVVTAAFVRAMPNYAVSPSRPPVSQDVTIYHAQPHGNCDGLRRPIRPDLFVDVTDLMDEKLNLLAQHESQRGWLDESQKMDSYLEAMKALLESVGSMSGRFRYAEGWRRHSHLGFCAPETDPLASSIAEHVLKAVREP